MEEYDPYSELESPELLGLINGKAGEPHFVHLCKLGISAVLYSNLNRANATVGDFVMVRVKRNPPAIADNHRSKHRVTYVRKVQYPDAVKGVKQMGRTVMLTLEAKPQRLSGDVLVLGDEQLGCIIDKDRKVPVDGLNENCHVLVDAMVVLSPRDPTSSIFAVAKFIKYLEKRCNEPNPRNQPRRPNHFGCIVDYQEPYCWVWCRAFDDVLRLDPTILSKIVSYGSWISFPAPSYYEDYICIEEATVIHNKFETRKTGGREFEIKVLCERFKKDNDKDFYLAKELEKEIFDSGNIIRDVNPDFPCTLWITPRLNSNGVVRWEFSARNEPELEIPAGEKTGIVTNALEFEYFVYSPFYPRDIMLHRNKLTIPDAIGKWITFSEVKAINNERFLIQGEVKIVPDVVPTRIRCNVPEILISCSILHRRNPVIFYSDDVAGDVVDINELVEDPDTVPLPFSAWAVKQRTCEYGCRWKISSQNGAVSTPVQSSSNASRDVPPDTQKADEIQQPVLPSTLPSESEIMNVMYKNIYGAGEYSDEEEEEKDDEESQASTVSSAAREVAKLELREEWPPHQEESRQNNEPNQPSFAGKSGQELVSILLDMPEVADSIRSQHRELHAALLNFAFNGDAPLQK